MIMWLVILVMVMATLALIGAIAESYRTEELRRMNNEEETREEEE